MVCQSVGWSVILSVCWSVITVSPAKMAEPIEMPFGVWIRWAQGIMCYMSRSPMSRGTYEGDDIKIFQCSAEHQPCGADIGISSHTVDQRSDWPTAEAVECRAEFFSIKIHLCNAASHQISLTTYYY